MKSITDKEFICVFQDLHGHLTTRGLQPNYIQLDNESSPTFQDLMKENTVDYQLAPPEMHQLNASERAIITFKDHFIAGLCSTDPKFLMQNWDRLLEQVDITLNLLRPPKVKPKIFRIHAAELLI